MWNTCFLDMPRHLVMLASTLPQLSISAPWYTRHLLDSYLHWLLITRGGHLNHTTQSNKIKYRLEHMHCLLHILMFVSAGGGRLAAAVNSWLVDELIGVFYPSLYLKWCSTNAYKCGCVSQPRKTISIEHMLLGLRIGLAVIFSMSSLTDLTCLPQAGA